MEPDYQVIPSKDEKWIIKWFDNEGKEVGEEKYFNTEIAAEFYASKKLIHLNKKFKNYQRTARH